MAPIISMYRFQNPNWKENHVQFINKNKDGKCIKEIHMNHVIYGNDSVAIDRKNYSNIMKLLDNNTEIIKVQYETIILTNNDKNFLSLNK